jgi:protoheme IX farnesyltransferase
LSRFTKYVWGLLAYNLAVVSWGVYLRATNSGDGCGSHWPDCDGSSTPLNGSFAKFVESSHRFSTELVGLLVVIMVVWAYRVFPRKHLVRTASLVTLGFTTIEAFVGRELVLNHLVTTNASGTRAVVMGFHVISTFLLMGSICTAGLASMGASKLKLRGQAAVGLPLTLGALGMMMLGVSGAISALGHTLKPVENVIGASFDPHTFWMVRLQPFHPLIAVAVGLYLALSAGLIAHLRPDPKVKTASQWMIGLFAAQLIIGMLNIWTKAPVGIQMIHLAVADLNWVSLVALAVFAFQADVEPIELRPPPQEVPEPEKLKGKELISAYVALTKPRVISLLLFTALAATIAAEGRWPGLRIFLSVAIGGYMVAGAANAINMVIDRDIDFTMKRTASRPTVTQSISSRRVLAFAFTLAFTSFTLLWSQANLLSAVMALCGLVFYVIVYTMLLKRRTWHNIVIGGAAGAFPPLVGWAAVTNDLPPLALYMFAIIFVWTPVHFWALALMLKDEYAAAGIPMLPVVKGDRNTVLQIAGYTVLTVVVTLLPFALPNVGWIYVGAAVILNAILVQRCVRLVQIIDRPRASSLFHYSMLYLALLFAGFAIDRTVVAKANTPSANLSRVSVRLHPAIRGNVAENFSSVSAAGPVADRIVRDDAGFGASSLNVSELR